MRQNRDDNTPQIKGSVQSEAAKVQMNIVLQQVQGSPAGEVDPKTGRPKSLEALYTQFG